MKTRLLLLLILFLLLTACASSGNTPEIKITPTKSDVPIWKVTKDTGLYDGPGVNANLIDTLPIGTLLKPASGNKFFDCDKYEDMGTVYTICSVEVIKTGKTGWVLQKWTESQ